MMCKPHTGFVPMYGQEWSTLAGIWGGWLHHGRRSGSCQECGTGLLFQPNSVASLKDVGLGREGL